MSTLSDLKPGIWNVDASHSEVGFIARHLMVSKVRGQFKDFAAVVTVAQPVELSTVEALSRWLDRHQQCGPRHSREVSRLFRRRQQPHHDLQVHKVTDGSLDGLLTIKGVTKAVSFDLEFGGVSADPWGASAPGSSHHEINRKDFNRPGTSPSRAARSRREKSIILDVQLVQA